MPPDGYTTVTISEETIAKLSQVMVRHEVESMSLTIDHAAQLALDEEQITNIELARLLYHRLQMKKTKKPHDCVSLL
jgi:galactokinase